jgi:hypothetical protein
MSTRLSLLMSASVFQFGSPGFELNATATGTRSKMSTQLSELMSAAH